MGMHLRNFGVTTAVGGVMKRRPSIGVSDINLRFVLEENLAVDKFANVATKCLDDRP